MKGITATGALLAFGSLGGVESGTLTWGQALAKAACFATITIISFVIENIREDNRAKMKKTGR